MPDVDRTPPFEQVAEHYRSAIRSGSLTVGDEAPSVRRMASEWGTAVSTAQRVTAALLAEGWIESRPSKPSVVTGRLPEDGG